MVKKRMIAKHKPNTFALVTLSILTLILILTLAKNDSLNITGFAVGDSFDTAQVISAGVYSGTIPADGSAYYKIQATPGQRIVFNLTVNYIADSGLYC